MNSYGHPQHPEVAMLDELHTLWGRVFGGEAEAPRPRAWVAAAALALIGAAAWLLF